MFPLFRSSPILDESSIHDIFGAFEWALKSFDSDVFYQQTVLVIPTNEHFPGRESDATRMVQGIFQQVKGYAGLAHWPFVLGFPDETIALPKHVGLLGALRGEQGEKGHDELDILIPYDESHLSDPEVMISSFAHMMAHFLALTSPNPMPATAENQGKLTELLGIFLGFGLEFANTAYIPPKTGCASCHAPVAKRQSYLTQEASVYALALFCQLKQISDLQVRKHLKSTLRSLYKQAVKDIKQRQEPLQKLKDVSSSIRFERHQFALE